MVRRLTPADAAAFQRLRIEAFRLHEREFRSSPEDEAKVSLDELQGRLALAVVAGAFSQDEQVGNELVGIAALTRGMNTKMMHKAFIAGMYVRAAFRGSGVADLLMSTLIEQARTEVEMVTLTVAADNLRAIRFYQRWGFQTYGVEPRSMKLADGSYVDEALMVCRFD